MKKLSIIATALFISCSPTLAQWQVPDHSVPVGRGSGTGFKFAAPGTAGFPLVSNGASSDPSFQAFPIGSVSGLGTNVATFLGTPSGANLAAALTTALPISKGGTGQTTQPLAITALMATPTRAGDVAYWNGTNWVSVAGNNSGIGSLVENASGVPSFGARPTVSVVTPTSHTGGFAANGSGTYTTPAGVSWIEIYIIGAGGGGGGGNNATPGGTGGNSCWNTTGAACTTPVYQAGGGAGGVNSGAGSAGGAISGSATCDWSVGGGGGAAGSNTLNVATTPAVGYPGAGGIGGSTIFGGAGGSGIGSSAGSAAATNSGAGGGGGGTLGSGTNGITAGSGGASGAACHVTITTPAATYTYVAGAKGAGASAGTTGSAGAAGGDGEIIVYEHYGS